MSDCACNYSDEDYRRLHQAHCETERRRAAYEEALTPSAETKRAYIAEFRFPLIHIDIHGRERTQNIDVPWTTIKEIMGAISRRAAVHLPADPASGEGEKQFFAESAKNSDGSGKELDAAIIEACGRIRDRDDAIAVVKAAPDARDAKIAKLQAALMSYVAFAAFRRGELGSLSEEMERVDAEARATLRFCDSNHGALNQAERGA